MIEQGDLQALLQILRESAHQELMGRFRRISGRQKADGSIVTEADLAMQACIQDALAKRFADIPLLGEEMERSEQDALLAAGGRALWILDPLDGTSNYAAGIPYFCVSLALLLDGQCQLAVIYDPIHDEMFLARKGGGATLNGEPLSCTPSQALLLKRSIGLVDFKRLALPLAQQLAAHPPYASQRSFGSGALDWCQIASGRCHVYLHGGQKLWDLAAGVLIARESGAYVGRQDGRAISMQQLEPQGVVAAVNQSLFDEWMGLVKSV